MPLKSIQPKFKELPFATNSSEAEDIGVDLSLGLEENKDQYYRREAEHKIKEKIELHDLRKEYAGKLFRLIKVWIIGVVIMLVLLGFDNGTTSALIAIGLTFGLVANSLQDLRHDIKQMIDSLKICPKCYTCCRNIFRGIRIFFAIMALFFTVWGLLTNLNCINNFLSFLCVEPTKNHFKLTDKVIITIVTSTTATILGLFSIAAYWLFGRAEIKNK